MKENKCGNISKIASTPRNGSFSLRCGAPALFKLIIILMIEYHLFSSPINELMWPVVINGCYITKAENQILMEVKLEFSGFFFFWIRQNKETY